jgi:hypothetical protein
MAWILTSNFCDLAFTYSDGDARSRANAPAFVHPCQANPKAFYEGGG